MPQIRRSADRRRRVLYQSHVAPHTPSTPATRRAAEELRAARQPAQAFGSRVHRQLRGRWFSLVPVSRLAMATVAAAVLAIPILLMVLHHLAVTWPSLAYREGIARPFRMDRPDSFAAWWTPMVLVLTAGAMRLIYVLRRHRRDDYRGHYHLWRLTLVVMLVASVHLTVGLVAWLGALIDLVIGDRAVLSGANWLRIALDVGGIILVMRLVAEVYRCRLALIALVSAAALMGFSEAAAWQLIAIDTMTRSTLVIAAPMLAGSCLLLSATVYLRALYRQVRNIADAPTMRQRVAEWMVERRAQLEDGELEIPESNLPAQPRRSATMPKSDPTRPTPVPSPTPVVAKKSSIPDAVETQEQAESKTKKPGLFSRFKRQRDEAEQADESPKAKAAKQTNETGDGKSKRRWLGLRSAKQISDDGASAASAEPESAPKKRGFSLRLKPQHTEAPAANKTANKTVKSTADASKSSGHDKPAKEKKGLLARIFGKKQATGDEDASSKQAGQTRSAPPKSSGPLSGRSATRSAGPLSASARNTPASDRDQANSDDEDIDFDNLDWEAMSKAERRRMRKKLKRSGRAA